MYSSSFRLHPTWYTKRRKKKARYYTQHRWVRKITPRLLWYYFWGDEKRRENGFKHTKTEFSFFFVLF